VNTIYIASLHKYSSRTHNKKELLIQDRGLHPVFETGIKTPFIHILSSLKIVFLGKI
jgi:hypothetical protein